MSRLDIILPNWDMPANVRAAATTRGGGMSHGPYRGFNLGSHVGDEPEAVEGNRRLLAGRLGLPAEPAWLEQVHGNEVVLLDELPDEPPRADAALTRTPGIPLAVLTADCLPVLFCDEAGREVAVAHAGWRGLAAGILQNTVDLFDAEPGSIHAWLGPAIGPKDFEVGEDVLQTYAARLPGSESLFAPDGEGKFLADIYQLARLALAGAGVTSVRGGGWSTFAEEDRFFSYRRDGETGRQATLIWMVE
ncbi:MAG: peptidoglycan editing factor PgeF [Gammaproteobacteria bacterium]|nr:peptidoglycan editing factor PgeF [Gammaproteobacteria bacterium]